MNITKRGRKTFFGIGFAAAATLFVAAGCSGEADFAEECSTERACAQGLVCSPSTRTCVALQTNGAPCGTKSDCFFACRKGVCAAFANEDEPCTSSDDCNTESGVVCAKFSGKPEGLCLATCPSGTCFGSKKCCTSPELPTTVCVVADACK